MLLVTFKVLERNQAQVWNDLLFNQSLSFCLAGNTRAAEAISRAFFPDESADIAYLHEFLVMNTNLLLIWLGLATGRWLCLANTFANFPDLDLCSFLTTRTLRPVWRRHAPPC